MSFKKFLKDFDKEYKDYILESARKQTNSPIELKDNKGSVFVWSGWDEKTLQLFTAYRNEKTTKGLVWATWFLAIGTLILSGLTIFFNILNNLV